MRQESLFHSLSIDLRGLSKLSFRLLAVSITLVTLGHSQEYTAMTDANHPDPISTPIIGPTSLSVSGNVVNPFTGTSSMSVPLLPGVVLSQSGSNVGMEISLENRDAASGWVGTGWALQLGRFVANLHATKNINDDDWYFIDQNGAVSRVVRDQSGILRLDSHPHWKVAFTYNSAGDMVTGVTVTREDGSTYLYGDFQDGIGPKAANRTAFAWGAHVGDYSTNSGSSSITYSWDLSQIKDNHGISILDISYSQENDTFQMSDGSKTYTRASYPHYIQNLRTGQKIEFVISDKGTGEWQAIEASPKLQSYETKYLSEIRVYPTSVSTTPFLRFAFSYTIVNSGPANKVKRLLQSIREYDQNSVSLPSLDFSYDVTKNYCLNTLTQPSGGTTTLNTDPVQLGYLNQATDTAATLISANNSLPDDHNTIAKASATTIAQLDKTNGVLTIKKWIGQWNSFSYSIPSMMTGASNENDGLMVSDDHVAVTYQNQSPSAKGILVFDWHAESITWQTSLSDLQTCSSTAGAMSPSGSLIVEYQGGTSYPTVHAWKWSAFTRSWTDLGSYVETNIQAVNQWPLESFQANDDCFLYDTPTGMFLRQAYITNSGASFPLVWSDTYQPSMKHWVVQDKYVGCYHDVPDQHLSHTGALIF